MALTKTKIKINSLCSLVSGLAGMFLIITPFTPLGIFQYSQVLFTGLILYIASFTFSIIALSRKEKSYMKYSPFILLVPFLLLIISLGPMIGVRL
ncbi:hypothetical protein [Halobacillus andaensis]|uniref:hypothetical protein n=1 Tax=Halobacillus andaensis TaxID=1176239 RepID=UPI00166D98BA|nr:hypothetical protein [Halobacillus andaensis]MBP2004336.1 hypothetical protein [Halobacillus andaensis]